MKTKHLVLSSFSLKIIGFISMTFDHVGIFLSSFYASTSLAGQIGFIFRSIGRIALPIFIFLLVNALRNSSSPKKYLFRIFIMWAIFFVLGLAIYIAACFGAKISILRSIGYSLPANAFNDLLYIGLFLYFLNHEKKNLRWISLLPLLLILFSFLADILNGFGYEALYAYFPDFIRADYSLFALLLALGFYFAKPLSSYLASKAFIYEDKNNEEITKSRQSITNLLSLAVILIVSLIFFAISYIDSRIDVLHFSSIGSFAILSGFILLFYNGKFGYKKKWSQIASYLYYPVHLIIITLVFVLLSI